MSEMTASAAARVIASEAERPAARSRRRTLPRPSPWLRGPVWDSVWVLNALWLAPLVLWLASGYADPESSREGRVPRAIKGAWPAWRHWHGANVLMATSLLCRALGLIARFEFSYTLRSVTEPVWQ